MALILLLCDLRREPALLEKRRVVWHPQMRAAQALLAAFPQQAQEIIDDLSADDICLTISWVSGDGEQHSGIGGVSDLDWLLPDSSTLSIVYECGDTSVEKIEASTEWMLRNQQ
jgi:hypothetical protein